MRRSGSASLVALLAITATVFMIGAIQKAPCANEAWVERREGVTIQCYSDVSQLLLNEQLGGDRLPYLDPCAPRPPDECDEYPPGSMYLMRAAAWIDGDGDPYWRFYWVNVVILLACALTITALLDRMGAQTALFAAAPTLALFGTMNWDLGAVALTTGATFAFLRGRDGWAGALLGAGMAVKLYPALVLLPMVIDRARGSDRAGATRLGGMAGGVYLLLNLPFALSAPKEWWNFFRYSSERDADGSTLWRIVCETVGCAPQALENLAPMLLTVGAGALVWRASTRRAPDIPRWTMAFPLLVLFLVTGKVWSSQYILWLLPWFALTAPAFRPYLFVQAAEVLVFITSFSLLARDQVGEGVPYPAVAVTVVLRAAALIWCLVTWVHFGHRGPSGFATRAPVLDRVDP